jgi:2'-5' RNA ligase
MTVSLRLFFALWPDDAARRAMAGLAREVAERAEGRSTREETIHLTMAFLGDIDTGRLPVLAAIGEGVARVASRFELTLDLVGGFRDARVAWLGAEPVPAPLAALADGLNEHLAAQGFRVDRRPFAAHVTLARKCRSMLRRERVAPVVWNVDRLSLVASEFAGGGSCYRTHAEWPLASMAGS